jgi:hypothetical protein
VKHLGTAECRQWLSTHGVPDSSWGRFPEGWEELAFHAPAESRRQLWVATLLVDQLSGSVDCLLRVEDLPLVDEASRALLGALNPSTAEEPFDLKRTPGLLFDSAERHLLGGWAFLMMAFLADCRMASSDGKMVLFTTNDEGCFLYTRESGLGEKLRRRLAEGSIEFWSKDDRPAR